MCELVPMANSDKALCWTCSDFSDGEAATTKLAARFQNVEACEQFKKAFEAAKEFNAKAKAGAEEKDLEWAAVVEDIEEQQADDIDVNRTAEGEDED